MDSFLIALHRFKRLAANDFPETSPRNPARTDIGGLVVDYTRISGDLSDPKYQPYA